jgi:hypothetical protein
VIFCPARLNVVGEADFSSVMADVWAAGTVAVDGLDPNGVVDPGGVPWTVAVLATLPRSTSAWVVE